MTRSKAPPVGAHTSAAGGAENALFEGRDLGASLIQLFTSNQKQWQGRKIQQDEVERFLQARSDCNIEVALSHDSYLINLGSHDPLLLEKSRTAFSLEIERCNLLELDFVNFHPGTATDKNRERCLKTITESLIATAPLLQKTKLRLLIETTAGQGNTVGNIFEDIAYLIEETKNHVPIGVCIDTCHIFAAGYDIRTPEAFDKTLKAFDEIVGLQHLYLFHVNDSMKPLGSRVDRHTNLGSGEIGLECFKFLMQDVRVKDLPKCLETPDGTKLWKEEIECLFNFYHHKTA